MRVVKKIIIYLVIAFSFLMLSLDAFVIKNSDVSLTFFLRLVIWAGLIAWMLYLDGFFLKKGDEEIKYGKTKYRIMSLVVIPGVVILLFVVIFIL